MNIPDYLKLPDPNDQNAIGRHRKAVFAYFNSFFCLADSALQDSTAKARDLFGLLNGPRDRAVHAMNTRYLLKVFLTAREIVAEEESADEQPEASNGGLSLEWVANCGVFVRLPEANIRILKPGPSGIPKCTSTTRSRYYESNQMLLSFGKNHSQPELPLTLVLLWDIDTEFNYDSLAVACPRTTRKDGTVDCFWIEKWARPDAAASRAAGTPETPTTDLDEITPKKPHAAKTTAKS